MKTLAKSPTFARHPRQLQFESDINRLFLYTRSVVTLLSEFSHLLPLNMNCMLLLASLTKDVVCIHVQRYHVSSAEHLIGFDTPLG